jgi:hypothetical protein
VRTWSKLSHRSEVSLLCWGQTIHANAEEVLVQPPLNVPSREIDVIERNWGFGCGVPNVVAPLLEKIRVALRETQEAVERIC